MYCKTMVESVQNVVESTFKQFLMRDPTRAAISAAYNSKRGIVIVFNGANRDFPTTKAQCTPPDSFLERK